MSKLVKRPRCPSRIFGPTWKKMWLMCGKKHVFFTYEGAVFNAEARHLYLYSCPCRMFHSVVHWHLTSRPRKKKK